MDSVGDSTHKLVEIQTWSFKNILLKKKKQKPAERAPSTKLCQLCLYNVRKFCVMRIVMALVHGSVKILHDGC